ncbi:hypothetical protein [Edaphovirga cremea]|uniref:hypothetical protein n=1 Tax=Edaphovirga cremea TaxID=2267246 RepID=UPI0039893D3D
MALKSCRECNARVSSEARVCPNCGIKKPYKSKITPIIFGLLMAVAAYAKYNSDKVSSDTAVASSTPQNTAESPSLLFKAPRADEESNETKPFTLAQVCRAGLATFMMVGVKTVKVAASPSSNIVFLSYKRPDDGKIFTLRCKLSRNNIIWAERDFDSNIWLGRGEVESLLTFTVNSKDVFAKNNNGKELVIEERYSDGGKIEKIFSLKSF